jgi:DNA repair ATPase RecN
VAFCLFFLVQVQDAGVDADGLANQKAALTKANENLIKQRDKNEKELKDREGMVAQSQKIQEQFAKESQTVKDQTTSAAQFERLHKQIGEMNDLVDKRKPLVEQSEKLQQQFSDLMKELNELALTGDADAKQIISAYGVQVNDAAKKDSGTPETPAKDDKAGDDKKLPDDKKPGDGSH